MHDELPLSVTNLGATLSPPLLFYLCEKVKKPALKSGRIVEGWRFEVPTVARLAAKWKV